MSPSQARQSMESLTFTGSFSFNDNDEYDDEVPRFDYTYKTGPLSCSRATVEFHNYNHIEIVDTVDDLGTLAVCATLPELYEAILAIHEDKPLPDAIRLRTHRVMLKSWVTDAARMRVKDSTAVVPKPSNTFKGGYNVTVSQGGPLKLKYKATFTVHCTAEELYVSNMGKGTVILFPSDWSAIDFRKFLLASAQKFASKEMPVLTRGKALPAGATSNTEGSFMRPADDDDDEDKSVPAKAVTPNEPFGVFTKAGEELSAEQLQVYIKVLDARKGRKSPTKAEVAFVAALIEAGLDVPDSLKIHLGNATFGVSQGARNLVNAFEVTCLDGNQARMDLARAKLLCHLRTLEES